VLTTSLRLLRDHEACADRYAHLVAALRQRGHRGAIPLSLILRLNGLHDALWALRATPAQQSAERDQVARLVRLGYARHVLPIYERQYPADQRPRNAIVVARLFAIGRATAHESAVASAAAGAAVRAAANATVRASRAACSAARDAMRAARDAARATETATASGMAWAAMNDAANDAASAAAIYAARAAESEVVWNAMWAAARAAERKYQSSALARRLREGGRCPRAGCSCGVPCCQRGTGRGTWTDGAGHAAEPGCTRDSTGAHASIRGHLPRPWWPHKKGGCDG